MTAPGRVPGAGAERDRAIAEAERALADLRLAMAEAIRNGDRELYVTLANRYGRLHQTWERLQRPQVGERNGRAD